MRSKATIQSSSGCRGGGMADSVTHRDWRLHPWGPGAKLSETQRFFCISDSDLWVRMVDPYQNQVIERRVDYFIMLPDRAEHVEAEARRCLSETLQWVVTPYLLLI